MEEYALERTGTCQRLRGDSWWNRTKGHQVQRREKRFIIVNGCRFGLFAVFASRTSSTAISSGQINNIERMWNGSYYKNISDEYIYKKIFWKEKISKKMFVQKTTKTVNLKKEKDRWNIGYILRILQYNRSYENQLSETGSAMFKMGS